MTLLLALTLLAPPETLLPPADKLLDEAFAAHRKFEPDSDAGTMPQLPAALIDLGRSDEAFALVKAVRSPLSRTTALSVCLGHHIRRTGTVPDIEALLAPAAGEGPAKDEQFIDPRQMLDLTVVEQLSRRGRPNEAEPYFRRIPLAKGSQVLRTTAAVSLTKAFRETGDLESARRIVRAGLEAGAGQGWWFGTSKQFDPLASAAVELEETAALEAALDVIDRKAPAAEPSHFPVIALARDGLWRAAMGDAAAAEHRFDAAHEIVLHLVDDARRQDEGRKPLATDSAAKAYVALALNERLAGFPKRADRHRDDFLKLVAAPGRSRDFTISDAAETCFNAGDRTDADRLVAALREPYYRVHVRLDLAKAALEADDKPEARKRLAEAKEVFDATGGQVNATGDETNRLSLLTQTASLQARLGNDADATDLFRQATELANAPGLLQMLSLGQVHAGRLADAYATIRRIPENDSARLLPLANLAAAAAEREVITAKPK
jgi:hypothetical protein